MRTNRVLNLKPSIKNPGDLMYHHAMMAAKPIVLPPKVSLRSQCSPVKDQGQMGSCSGFATVASVEFLELQELRLSAPDLQIYVANQFVPASELFVYWGERVIEGSTDEDEGATTLRDACLVATQTGVAREALWPYKQSNLLVAPNAAAFTDAGKHKVKAFYGLNGIDEIKHCLASGYPLVFGLQVSGAFMDAFEPGGNGVVPPPKSSDQYDGGHALSMVGFNDITRQFELKNSWGKGAGDDGFGFISYDCLDIGIIDDLYTLRNMPTNTP